MIIETILHTNTVFYVTSKTAIDFQIYNNNTDFGNRKILILKRYRKH